MEDRPSNTSRNAEIQLILETASTDLRILRTQTKGWTVEDFEYAETRISIDVRPAARRKQVRPILDKLHDERRDFEDEERRHRELLEKVTSTTVNSADQSGGITAETVNFHVLSPVSTNRRSAWSSSKNWVVGVLVLSLCGFAVYFAEISMKPHRDKVRESEVCERFTVKTPALIMHYERLYLVERVRVCALARKDDPIVMKRVPFSVMYPPILSESIALKKEQPQLDAEYLGILSTIGTTFPLTPELERLLSGIQIPYEFEFPYPPSLRTDEDAQKWMDEYEAAFRVDFEKRVVSPLHELSKYLFTYFDKAG